MGHHPRYPGDGDNVWCPQVSRVKAEARLALLRAAGLDVDAWLAGAMVGTGEETPTGLDPGEFDDYEDSDEPDEDDEPGPAARTYPYTCRVIFGYQVWPCLPGPHPACPGMAPQPLCHFVPISCRAARRMSCPSARARSWRSSRMGTQRSG